VQDLRASGEGRLRKGRRTEEFTATELPDEEKLPLLRAYLKKWAWEVGAFFQAVGADAPDEDLRRIAPLTPHLSDLAPQLMRGYELLGWRTWV
jgi:hypothetical protein